MDTLVDEIGTVWHPAYAAHAPIGAVLSYAWLSNLFGILGGDVVGSCRSRWGRSRSFRIGCDQANPLKDLDDG